MTCSRSHSNLLASGAMALAIMWELIKQAQIKKAPDERGLYKTLHCFPEKHGYDDSKKNIEFFVMTSFSFFFFFSN